MIAPAVDTHIPRVVATSAQFAHIVHTPFSAEIQNEQIVLSVEPTLAPREAVFVVHDRNTRRCLSYPQEATAAFSVERIASIWVWTTRPFASYSQILDKSNFLQGGTWEVVAFQLGEQR